MLTPCPSGLPLSDIYHNVSSLLYLPYNPLHGRIQNDVYLFKELNQKYGKQRECVCEYVDEGTDGCRLQSRAQAIGDSSQWWWRMVGNGYRHLSVVVAVDVIIRAEEEEEWTGVSKLYGTSITIISIIIVTTTTQTSDCTECTTK